MCFNKNYKEAILFYHVIRFIDAGMINYLHLIKKDINTPGHFDLSGCVILP